MTGRYSPTVEAAARDGLRLTELIAAISLATDLGTGQPMEHALRTCRLSMAVAHELRLDTRTASDVHYVALLRFLGCVADAPEMAHLAGGDNLAFIASMAPVYMGSTGEVFRTLAHNVGLGESLPQRASRLVEPGGGRAAIHLGEDRRPPRRAHLREDRGHHPARGRPVRDGARSAA
jgi:hypothetical protein